MLIEIACGEEKTRADLNDGQVKVGGAPTDEVRIVGLPRSLVTLRIEGDRLTVMSRQALTIGRSIFPPHVPRLVVGGEEVQLSSKVSLRQVISERRTKGTATVMRELLQGELAVEHTRAPTLTCLTGADAGSVCPLGLDEMLIGRSDDCALQIRDRAVSRKHARVVQRNGRMWVEDLRGANGTFVNGRMVLRKQVLQPGDVVELGQTLLRYDAPDAEKPHVPTPPSVFLDPALCETVPPRAALPPWKWGAVSMVGSAVAALVGVLCVLLAVL